MGKTKIEWTEFSWNPIRARNRDTGKVGHFCVHVSEGCRNCYAERMQTRFGNPLRFAAQDQQKVDLFLDEKMLTQPLRWKKPRMIFACSMTDLFADFVPDEWIDRVFAVMAMGYHHTFQVLTKRAARMQAYAGGPRTPGRIWDVIKSLAPDHSDQFCDWMGANPQLCRYHQQSVIAGANLGPRPTVLEGTPLNWPYPNVWLGVSAEDQETAAARIPDLLATPAAVRFVSYEPALGPVDFTELWANDDPDQSVHALAGLRANRDGSAMYGARLDWIIAGGESGPNARPAHPDWFRRVRDDCAAAGVAFHFKQQGEWAAADVKDGVYISAASACFSLAAKMGQQTRREGDFFFVRVGKKRAGRLLDGVEHNGFPKVPA